MSAGAGCGKRPARRSPAVTSTQPTRLPQPWRTSSAMPYESSSAASEVALAWFGLRILRSMQPSAARGETAECVALRKLAAAPSECWIVANALVRPGHLRATAFLAKRSSARGARDDSSWGDCGAAWRSMTTALRIAAGGCCGRSRLLSLDVCEADQAPGPAAPLTTIALHGSAKAGMKTSAEPGECSRLEARGDSAPPRPFRQRPKRFATRRRRRLS